MSKAIGLLMALLLHSPASAQLPAPTAVYSQAGIHGDSTQKTGEWNEFYHSPEGLLKAGTGYTIRLRYHVLNRSPKANFYAMVRGKDKNGHDSAMEVWQGEAGASGQVTVAVPSQATDDCSLILGIRNQGAIDIQDLHIETDPANTPLILPSLKPKKTWHSPGRTAYYVDSVSGDDSSPGQAPTRAWRTLDKLNSGQFAPGDQILLKSGSRWQGYLTLSGCGSQAEPIQVKAYGEGSKPRIDGQQKIQSTALLRNCQYFELSDLDITNAGPVHQPGMTGVRIEESNVGIAHHLSLRGLEIHDISGATSKHGGGSAITCWAGGDQTKTRIDGLLIENCHIYHVDRDGITMFGGYDRNNWFPHRQVVIRGNRLEDIGGDGIVPSNCDGALVEHNVLRGGRMRAPDSAAGIWPIGCDNTLLQYNEVSGMKGTQDGEAYDCDWNCRGTTFQYNFSHDNDGGFMLICNFGSVPMPKNIGNRDSVVRYNISVNDGLHSFHISGPCQHTQIYNNVVYLGQGRQQQLILAGNWGRAWPNDLLFCNNLFYVERGGSADFDLGLMTDYHFDHNLYWGQFTRRPEDLHALLDNPHLVAPGGMRALDYRPQEHSPCLQAGAAVGSAGLRDFAGSPLPVGVLPSIGAFQKAP